MKIFYLVWGIWFLMEILLNRTKKSKVVKKSSDKGTLNIIWLAILFAISLGIILMYNLNLPFSNNLSVPYLGIFLIIVGVIIRAWAIISLWKSFTVDVAIDENQKLKTNGLYKLIRHPSYLGNLISFIGLGLSLNNILSFLIITILVGSAFLYRIKIEEKALSEKFGQEYDDYMKKSKKLIPFIY